MTTLTLFSMSPNSAQAYTNDSKTLEEAKKAHPNAQVKVNKDTGAYTYTYDKNNAPNNNHQNQSRTNDNHQHANQRDFNDDQYILIKWSVYAH